MSLLWILLVVALVLAATGGVFSVPRYGYVGWSPLGAVIFVVLVLWLLGRL